MSVRILLEKVHGGFVATASHDGCEIAHATAVSGDLAVRRAKAKVIDLSEEDVEFDVIDMNGGE